MFSLDWNCGYYGCCCVDIIRLTISDINVPSVLTCTLYQNEHSDSTPSWKLFLSPLCVGPGLTFNLFCWGTWLRSHAVFIAMSKWYSSAGGTAGDTVGVVVPYLYHWWQNIFKNTLVNQFLTKYFHYHLQGNSQKKKNIQKI